jgi:ribosomal RNA-processing protein 9
MASRRRLQRSNPGCLNPAGMSFLIALCCFSCLINPFIRTMQPGYINSLHFSRSGKYLVAGIGQEHRFGRWARIPEAKNGICIIPLPTAAK